MKNFEIRHLGVTVLPEYIQSEGATAILDRIQRDLRGTSVTTSPCVAMEVVGGSGSREPPLHAGAGPKRLLERPLWGKREVWIQTAPSFVPNSAFYADTPYKPANATDLTYTDGRHVEGFLNRAKERGMTTWLQVMAAIPSGLRLQLGNPRPGDRPMMANGRPVPDRVDRNASLASEGLRRYMRGLIRDLNAAYPDIDGFKFDWPEYPPYHLLSLFADYNPQVAPYASEIGLDLRKLARAMTGIRLEPILAEAVRLRRSLADVLADLQARNPAVADHFRLRRHLTTSFAHFLREEVDAASGGQQKVFLQGFPPPWNSLSGFDPVALDACADEIGIKFYTMHWPVIGENYVRHANCLLGLDPANTTAWFRAEFMGDPSGDTSQLGYPAPDAPHGVTAAEILKKWQAVGLERATGISHAYGPVDDVVMLFKALFAATDGRMEINRYAYLNDEKISELSKFLCTVSPDPEIRAKE